MGKRDLKADLELFNKATPGPWEFGPIYAGTIAGELDEERDRANRELLNDFREGWPHAAERAIKAEALVRELTDTLDANIWVLHVSIETDESEQARRNIESALNKTKEVLGDDEG